MNSKGTYYPRKLKKSWAVYLQFFKDGKRVTERVHTSAYGQIGIREDMSFDDMKAALQRTNETNTIENRSRVRAAARAEEQFETDALYFPEDAVSGFLTRLEEQNFGSDLHLSKLKSHFRFVQTMIIKLKISPKDYSDRASAFYKYFVQEKISLEYANRILRILNAWGRYVSKQSNSFFEEAGYIKQGQVAAQITAVQSRKSEKVRRAANPLTLKDLAKIEGMSDLSQDTKNYFFITLWLGLRPSEVKSALESELVIKLVRDTTNEIDVLHFYQAKLSTKAEGDRWKLIPLIHDQQLKAAKLLMSQAVHVPHSKTIAKYAGDGFDQYSGRKGFTDLMLELGHDLTYISAWLGHTSVKTTLDHYKDKKKVMYRKPG